MLFKAKLNHLRISPRKVRLVTDLIRGLPVKQAEIQLKFLTKRSSIPILKLLNSAVANAKNNGSISKDNLFVSDVRVDVGPTLKRWRARAMGRASAIMKRTSHITLTLNQIKETEKVPMQKPSRILDTEGVGKDEKEKTLLEEIGKVTEEKKDIVEKEKQNLPPKPYSTTSKSKKRFFSRQTFGNAKKTFRRKSF
ncbi:MAG: 50S ribosomal protein L22 [Patescibacteria group bacterium]|nr:50S ribosomal protein L22 [Patescibacteria group bacterium]